MLLLFSIFTINSYGVSPVEKTEQTTVKLPLVRWFYTCYNGATGSFLMPEGSTHAQALSVAQAICGG